jgi:hypothetical protein
LVSGAMLDGLPEPVQRYLQFTGTAVVLTATAGFVWYGMGKSKVRSGAAMLPDGSRPLSSTQPGSGRVPTYSVVRLFLR